MAKSMRVAVVGTGALGLLIAYLLSRAEDAEIWLLDHHPDRASRIQKQGVLIEGISGTHRIHPRITVNPCTIGKADLVIFCVKSPDTYKAAANATALIGPETILLTLQNGLGNIEAIERAVGAGRTVGGTTSMGATLLGPNHVRHAGWGETIIGEPSGNDTGRIEKILALFHRAGLEASSTNDLQGLLWSKLVINVGINPLTALTGLRNGELLRHDGTRTVMKTAVEEATAVASSLGIRLLYDDPLKKVMEVCEATAGNISSMLQDILRGKKTEIEHINGAVVREAEARHLSTPANRTLLHLVKTVEESYRNRVQGWPLSPPSRGS